MTAETVEPASKVDLAPGVGGGGEIPSFDITLKVRRYDPEVSEEARWDDFKLTMYGTDRVLDALHKAKWEHDGSVSFRRSCAHGVCGSDAMRINGRNRLACKTLLKDLDTSKPITVEPIKGLPVEKDLIVDMEPFFQSYREIMPFLVAGGNEPTMERYQSQEDRARFDDTTTHLKMRLPLRDVVDDDVDRLQV
jgi:succinate dehydrogenase / fumarate reductase iron-sulfur subunit